MEQYFAYEDSRRVLSGKADSFNAAALFDIDGVLDDTKTLTFQDLPIKALAVLQGFFREINLLTGRYAQLFANCGVQKFIECGFDFSKPFRYFAEMGGLEICLVDETEIYQPGTKNITSDRKRIFRIVDTPAKAEVRCGDRTLYWIAKLHAPEITDNIRDLIWQTVKTTIAQHIKTGDLQEFGIQPDESVEDWAPRLYNRELENITKGTVTTSRVPANYADLALAVHTKIGDQVATAINQALEDYNADREQKLTAQKHLDCVEVLFDGIDKFVTAQRIIQGMDKRAGIRITNIFTFGDGYTDLKMSQAAVKLGRTAIHFHFGSHSSFLGQFNQESSQLLPAVSIVFSRFEFMIQNNPHAAITVSSVVLWHLVESIYDYVSYDTRHKYQSPLEVILKGIPGATLYGADYRQIG